MEKLFEIHQEGRFDFLVLDTPPSRNALDFLDAPKRLTQFIEGRGMQMFMRPTGFATKVVGRGSLDGLRRAEEGGGNRPARGPRRVLPGLQRHGGRLPRARQAGQRAARRPLDLLHDRLRPQGEPIEEAVFFHRKLVEAKLPVGGVIVNKVHYESEADPLENEVEEELRSSWSPTSPSASPPTSATTRRWPGEVVQHLARELNAKQVIRVPYMVEDVTIFMACSRSTAICSRANKNARKWPLPERIALRRTGGAARVGALRYA